MQPPAEARERAAGADHAMPGQHDRKRIAPVGGTDGAGPVAAEPEASCLLAVADRLSVWNGRERELAAALEVGPVQLEREVERPRARHRSRPQLARGVFQDGRPPFRSDPAAVEQHALEPRVGCDEAQRPDWTVDDRAQHLVNLERAPGAAREIAPTMAGPALLAQLVEHLHGKEGVDGSSPSEGLHANACK